jgi:hypothetical protein
VGRTAGRKKGQNMVKRWRGIAEGGETSSEK